jgi:hypothetical protein
MRETTPEVAELLERLERLERQNDRLGRHNRRLLAAALAALVLVGAALLVPLRASPTQAQQSQSRSLEADKLTLRDGNGKTRAELVLGAGGPGWTSTMPQASHGPGWG